MCNNPDIHIYTLDTCKTTFSKQEYVGSRNIQTWITACGISFGTLIEGLFLQWLTCMEF